MRNSTDLVAAVVRQSVFGLLVLALSFPFVRLLHQRFSLGPPPLSALVTIGAGVLLAFMGAGAIGALIGGSTRATGRKTAAMPLAVGGALLWSLLVCGALVPYYASNVAQTVAEETALNALRDRKAIFERARGALDDVRGGRSRDLATKTAAEAWQKSQDLARSGAARLPALILLGWTILGAPLGAAWECRRARR